MKTAKQGKNVNIYTLQWLQGNKWVLRFGQVQFNFFHFPIPENTKINVDAKLLHGYKKPLATIEASALVALGQSLTLSRPRGCHNYKRGESA